MVSQIRAAYNAAFTDARYQAFLKEIENTYNYRPPFRIAETPVFIPKDLKQQLFEACESITDVLCQDDFKALSQSAVLSGQTVPNETDHTTFLQMDFGICKDPNGGYIPQLIEVQGFPSLYVFQDMLANGR